MKSKYRPIIAKGIFALLTALLAVSAHLTAKAQAAPSQEDAAVAVLNNPRHTGAIRTSGLNPPLTVKWIFQLPNPPSFPSNILIAEGKVFVSAANYYYSNQNYLYALDAQTGKLVWGPVSITNGSFGAAYIAYDAGRIFAVPFTTPNFGYGEMFAYDAETGQQLWQTTLPKEYTFDAPTAYNGIVYVVGATFGDILYALNESDGTLLWSLLSDYGGFSVPAVTRDGVYLSFFGPHIDKLDPKNGKLLWRYDSTYSGGTIYGIPVVYEGKLYDVDTANFSSGMILNAKDGTVAGNFVPPANVFPRPPTTADGRLFFTSQENLIAQDTGGNSVFWTVANNPNNPFSSPTLAVNDTLYLGTGGSSSSYGPASLIGYNMRSGRQTVYMDLSSYGIEVGPMSAAEGILVVPVSSYLIAMQHGIGLSRISLATSTITGGQSTQATVFLNAPAPEGGVTLRLAGIDPVVSVPATISIPAGKTEATIIVSTSTVSQVIFTGVQATLGLQTVNAYLEIVP